MLLHRPKGRSETCQEVGIVAALILIAQAFDEKAAELLPAFS